MVKVIYIICGIGAFIAISIGIYIVSDHYVSQIERSLVKEATLRDLKGKSWQISHLNEKVGVVYFGYTYCPDICPFSLQIMAGALDQLRADERALRLRVPQRARRARAPALAPVRHAALARRGHRAARDQRADAAGGHDPGDAAGGGIIP